MTPEQRLIKRLGKELAKRDAVINDLRKQVATEKAEVQRLGRLIRESNDYLKRQPQ